MKSEILNRKPIIKKNNEEIIDITSGSVQYITDNPIIIKEITVSEDMEMRPDLVSKIAYGRIDYVDVLMKFNGISNPYSIEFGTLITVPEISYLMDSLTKSSKDILISEVLNQYIDPSKKSETDINKVEYDERIKKLFKLNTNAKFVKLPLPPNLAQPGSKEGTFVNNNSILLGSDITKNSN